MSSVHRLVLVSVMLFAFLALCVLALIIVEPLLCSGETICPDGRLCPRNWMCCVEGCCAPVTTPSHQDSDAPIKGTPYVYHWYAEWYFVFLLLSLAGIIACCTWCVKRSSQGIYMCSLACCVRRPTSEHDSAGSVYPPPRYSRCGSFHQAPPPYSEVTSKPDLYPLVITCGEGDGKAGGNYLMVHYFRNYVIRAPGSLSATSTAESLNSSFICNSANEANSVIPPPYSCASNYEEYSAGGGAAGGCRSMLRSLSSLTERDHPTVSTLLTQPPVRSRTAPEPTPRPKEIPEIPDDFRKNLITSPAQPVDPNFDYELDMIDCELYCEGGCKPKLGPSPSPPMHHSDDDDNDDYEVVVRELFNNPKVHKRPFEVPGSCESPPQPTSPTMTSRESTLRRQSDERRYRRMESTKKSAKIRKSSLYMPLAKGYSNKTRISPGGRASARSAPVTPSSSLVPNLLSFSQRISASRHSSKSARSEEEYDLLLAEIENTRTDHKF